MNVLREFIGHIILIEGRIDDLVSRYPEFAKDIKNLALSDPSGRNKYLDWEVRQLIKGATTNDIIPTVQFFHDNVKKFEKKDINSYKTLKDLEDTVKNIGSKPSKRSQKEQVKSQGVEKLIDNDEFTFMYVKDKDASICYGSGTKWCITMKNANYWEEYAGNNVIIYFLIDKTKDDDDPLKKVAFAAQRDFDDKVINIDVFNALDDQMSNDENFDKFIKLIEVDAPKRPEGMLVKIKNGSATEDEFLQEYGREVKRNKIKFIENANKKYLPLLMHDDSSAIRVAVSTRIDPKYLPQMMNDSDDNVREEVAKRIDPSYLPEMINDERSYVRINAVKRIDPSYLPEMINDEDVYVRQAVAQRIDPSYLPQMMNDPSWIVREYVASVINPKYLPQMMNDENKYVKLSIAHRIDPKYIPEFISNTNDQDIRKIAMSRMQ